VEASAQTLVQAWRRVGPIVVVSVIYFGMLVYPVLRILGLAFPQWQPGTFELLTIMVGPLAGRLGYELAPSLATRWLSAVTLTWLGVCFVAFTLVLTWEAINLLYTLPPQASGWTLLSLTGIACSVGFVNAQTIAVKTVNIANTQLQQPVRIAQISDVHVGSRSGRFLSRVVKRTNAQSPDFVFITGDLVDFRNVSEQELASLGDLRAPSYFIIGNHERYVDCEQICQRLGNLGITVLRNSTQDLGDIQLIGIDDAEPKTQVGRVLPTLTAQPGKFRILLYHRPDGARAAAAWGAQLMLCGHTHAGQIVPFNFLVRRIFPHIKGLYHIDGMNLYVSPGTGTWGPILRLGSRCEISMIALS
jgi:predicted MPP superfamily phosphohydrolase